MKVRIDNKELDLPANFGIEVQETSPIYNDLGSQTIPATVPATTRNNAVFRHSTRLDSGLSPNRPSIRATIEDGGYIRKGLVNVTNAGKREGITFNIGLDNSQAYAKWSSRKLRDISTLPIIDAADIGYDEPSGPEALQAYMTHLYTQGTPQEPLAVFPIVLNNQSTEVDGVETTYWEMLNVPMNAAGQFRQPTKVKRIIDGAITTVTIPEGYGLSPFIRVWKALALIFEDLGVTITSNPFDPAENDELARLVVLNNVADSTCTGLLRYADLMPDCTVEEFLHALWVRFGLVYSVDFDEGLARLELLRDVLKKRSGRLFTEFQSSPIITYNTGQYIKLSAKTTLEGAEPATARFEDYINGLDLSTIRLGQHVSQWRLLSESKDWDGPVRDDYWQEDYDPGYEYPDRDSDRDDDGPEYASARAAAKDNRASSADESHLAREFVTGQWYKLDSINGAVKESSSSFFVWDPQSEGLEPMELASEDECVPVGRVVNNSGSGHMFSGMAPMYLTGARHYHTFIKGSDEDIVETPLAFMFAYELNGETIGRNTPEGEDGLPVTLRGGGHPATSLLFQFKDGLFAQYWKDYDEILRHGNRTIEVGAYLHKVFLRGVDMLRPEQVFGARCLIDKLDYALPTGNTVPITLTLRTITTQGKYDIAHEQGIPNFSSANRRLEWSTIEDEFGTDLLFKEENKTAAKNLYVSDTGYEPHGVEGDYYFVDTDSAVPVEGEAPVRLTSWVGDADLPTPTKYGDIIERSYRARLKYNIWEIRDIGQREEPDYEYQAIFLGQVEVDVPYKVTLRASWVME